MAESALSDVGLVVIGRNEGERLVACLRSVVGCAYHIVYVDSGSTDGSVEMAIAMGVHVIQLDMSVPFTAARARNAGWRCLLAHVPTLEFMQFVDGDCEVIPGWLNVAVDFMRADLECAVVCGRLIEKYPEHSIYNRICQYEWEGSVGETNSSGGIAMFKLPALVQVNGFCESLIAGEEPELCYRLRMKGWKVMRLRNDMAYHDAAILRFSQWWMRSTRAGYTFAEGAWSDWRGPERRCVRECARSVLWGGVIPAMILLGISFGFLEFLWLSLLYVLQFIRELKRGGEWRLVLLNSIAKFSEFTGVIQFIVRRTFGSPAKLIEYK